MNYENPEQPSIPRTADTIGIAVAGGFLGWVGTSLYDRFAVVNLRDSLDGQIKDIGLQVRGAEAVLENMNPLEENFVQTYQAVDAVTDGYQEAMVALEEQKPEECTLVEYAEGMALGVTLAVVGASLTRYVLRRRATKPGIPVKRVAGTTKHKSARNLSVVK